MVHYLCIYIYIYIYIYIIYMCVYIYSIYLSIFLSNIHIYIYNNLSYFLFMNCNLKTSVQFFNKEYGNAHITFSEGLKMLIYCLPQR